MTRYKFFISRTSKTCTTKQTCPYMPQTSGVRGEKHAILKKEIFHFNKWLPNCFLISIITPASIIRNQLFKWEIQTIAYISFTFNMLVIHPKDHYFQYIPSLLICAYTVHLYQISLPYPNLCMYTKMRRIFSSKFWDCICSCNITPLVLYVSLMFTQSKTILWEGKRGEFVDSGLFAFSFLCG